MKEIKVTLGAKDLLLTTDRCVFHKESSNLILSDLHLGKSSHFQKNGIAIPQAVAKKDLMRLGKLIDTYAPNQVIIAGDFFHASANSELDLFAEWKAQYEHVKFILVKGNHDRLPLDYYRQLNIELHKETYQLGSVVISHHPEENPTQPIICGHIHPGVLIRLSGRQKLRLPSYLLQPKQLILPAFSLFTGLDLSLQETGVNYPFTKEEIFEYPLS